jgi:hypothetical protein
MLRGPANPFYANELGESRNPSRRGAGGIRPDSVRFGGNGVTHFAGGERPATPCDHGPLPDALLAGSNRRWLESALRTLNVHGATMIKQKRVLIVGGVAISLGIALFASVWWLHEPRIDEQAYSEIVNGMTLREVERILNAPAGYTTDPMAGFFFVPGPGQEARSWVGQELQITVFVDCHDIVADKMIMPVGWTVGHNQSPTHRLRRWLGLEPTPEY